MMKKAFQRPINYWWITASEYSPKPKRRWHWQRFFNDPEEGYDWGGPKWIQSRASYARIEEMRKGDIVVAYQAREGVRGVAYLASDGYSQTDDGNFDTFDLKGRPTVWFDNPIPLQKMRGLPGAKEQFEFLKLLHGTVFHISKKGFRDLIDLAIQLNPRQKLEIGKFRGTLRT